MQAPPLQQPPAQLVALQTHAPPTHARPGPQAGFEPHLQLPAVQTFAVVALQAVHAAPPVPQAEVELVWQTPLRQQPEGQFPAPQPEQALPTQV